MTDLLDMPIIDRYTRQDAIADGVLIDVSETAREAGLKFPVAMTTAVHAKYVSCDEQERELGQDPDGRLWDILHMLIYKIRLGGTGERIWFKVIIQKPDRGDWDPQHETFEDDRTMRLVTLKALCHGGDSGEPVITILKPDED